MFSVDEMNRANYYKYLARLNFEAAEAADRDVGLWPGYEIAAPPPVMTLCAHAIELSFKAYLLDQGVDEREVRQIGHDLVTAKTRCEELGADTTHIDIHLLEIIADLLGSGRLRYGDKSELGRVPVYGPLSELVNHCLGLCGAPRRADILEGAGQ